MYRNILLPLLMLLLLAITQMPAAHAAAPVPLLWKVSDADNSLYLLGSFHLLKAQDYPLSEDVEAAFADAASLLFEIDPAEMASPNLAMQMQRAALIADGKTLADVLPKQTWANLQKMLQASSTPIAQIENNEPWAITMSIALNMAQAMGFEQEQGLDNHFMMRANRAGKPVAGLETAVKQLSVLDATPYAEQANDLDELIDDPQSAIEELNELHAIWRAGDAAAIDKQMLQQMLVDTPETYRLLIVNRNNDWMPELARRLDNSKSDNTLVVVGAAHLIGADGLIEKMRAKGYKIERLCTACDAK
ncbi:MAG: TraB/GumN family protein [Nevskiaceae bacterium]|jgi:uncharacterized protein YbaP (TraB family)|nr:TraB/GumN family protein [Nevskiaceae bacterium]